MTDLAAEAVRLLRQARRWFTMHPSEPEGVSVEADPREVQRWMVNTDHALLEQEETAQARPRGGPGN
jgi:hypothetical protein